MAESESWYPSIAALARSGRKRNEGFEREKTIVGGRVVVRGGRMTTVDEAAFRAELQDVMPAFRRDFEALRRTSLKAAPALLDATQRLMAVDVGLDRFLSDLAQR